mgnify:CR=1 FL=1
MVTSETLKYELQGRFLEAQHELGKSHVSVRYEPVPRVARVGVMLDEYDWDHRLDSIRILRKFEAQHADEFAIEFDILPLEAVTDETYAEA